MKKTTIHLICNAHLDPVWLWEWEEGAAEAISTFRVAADFCEQYDGFVFNHNEVILYEWVEEYEPELFKRIQKLVKQGKWQIMGGWYLQPDCNMPSGESFVRQILLGRNYFQEKFGVKPTTAINFDPFGHSRGIVQILAKSGYDSYYFCRPDTNSMKLDKETFLWEGFDGSQVMACRSFEGYLSLRGTARAKIEKYIPQHETNLTSGAICWGIGNHGGGPSHIDMRQITELIEKRDDVDIIHSTMENYFASISKQRSELPVWKDDLNPWAVGCYTSQVQIKQKHRLLENELFMTEKMLTTAWVQGLLTYPASELKEVMKSLAHAEFHDILPGSSIQPVEESSIRLMDYALEIISRLKARAFFALSKGQKKAREDEIPVLVYNPHPHEVEAEIECEFQLADQNHETNYTDVKIHCKGKELPTQIEKEASNLNLDWRKKVIFRATLKPSTMERFDCLLKKQPEKRAIAKKPKNGILSFKNESMTVEINTRTGLIDNYKIGNRKFLEKNAFKALVMDDNEDPWGMNVTRFRKKAGSFKLMSKKESALHAGVQADSLPAVRVVEDGNVRTVVEACFKYENSYLLLIYKIPKKGTQITIEARVNWNEKDKMLKLSLPTTLKNSKYMGQTAYGVQLLPDNGNEAIAHKWVAAVDQKSAVRLINDGLYGSDFKNGEIRMSLVRSSAYSGHPIGEKEIVPQDRFICRIDQGERLFSFWLDAGNSENIMETADSAALAKNEKPMPLSFFPAGSGQKPANGIKITGGNIQLTACKKAEKSNKLVMRLFEPAGKATSATVKLPFANSAKKLNWTPFEIKTVLFDNQTKKWHETGLMET